MSKKSFDYLLTKDFELNIYKPEVGIDTLGIAIIFAASQRENATYIISSMLNRGAIITDHHVALLEGVKNDSPDAYAKIISNIPELADNLTK